MDAPNLRADKRMKIGLVAANGGFVTLASDEFDESTLHLFEHERQATTRRCGAFGEDDPGSLVIETGQDRRGAKLQARRYRK